MTDLKYDPAIQRWLCTKPEHREKERKAHIAAKNVGSYVHSHGKEYVGDNKTLADHYKEFSRDIYRSR
ncbi:MAG: hypothetical protein AAB573_02640 [Patescibacteria group bacterium]